ncbi:MAG: cytochrome b [Microcoleus sp. PH2017_29_MFU_D_A]|jgi:cytochrome b561|uniref:cytochrome b n=1 Tax=unclassified Microcoleus TaxID=2642155 RepID=UPI001D52D182|nr:MULTISPECIES: cytochrome b/b6 domain-containing protein [unclassified Microcoleus]MCC3421483.1 cytochrome b [Microcoleus sp. PH2017_07_MST_O_A]MCC3431351.1 cytochrome b [Microcoleus sp. PH2017_04_SCI_O_A]MCC3469396.1 cytochrome b [Microcoleus sp. PH2017_06_SFM_O_A]MCC3506983.1 cytochrome b [Microcoleus sp. PH2017_19_SFW_U_A]MCC3513204.1 cytochrome b [Microcoleus sp. PH2017_17_BER_D_A]TAE62394.1 MAG: cytochrome b [Oscillatoriales cyanobacterium]
MSSLQTVPKKPRLNSAFQRLMSVHWWMASCYLVLFVVGTFMSQMPRNDFRDILYDFHKSIGVLTMALLTWRILTLLQVVWKKYTKRQPKFSLQWLKNFALHTLMYIFMWAVPIAGFLLSNSFRANGVKFFGLVLPDVFPQDAKMVELGRALHFWLSYTFLAFIALHLIVQWKVAKANWRRLKGFIEARISTQRN